MNFFEKTRYNVDWMCDSLMNIALKRFKLARLILECVTIPFCLEHAVHSPPCVLRRPFDGPKLDDKLCSLLKRGHQSHLCCLAEGGSTAAAKPSSFCLCYLKGGKTVVLFSRRGQDCRSRAFFVCVMY
jgi:hypothetical protein